MEVSFGDSILSVPAGAVIGLIGEKSSASDLLSSIARKSPSSRLLGPLDELDWTPVDVLCLDQTFALKDAFVRLSSLAPIERLRRRGCRLFLSSHDEQLLRSISDEVWWVDANRIAASGDPAEVLPLYRRHITGLLRAAGELTQPALDPALRRGDGRARILALETVGANGNPTGVWQSGEQATVRVVVRFDAAVSDPVIGIMIRTRIGFEVYGTNTELESIKVGPCAAGDEREILFTFRCELCPQEYTLTAASHDPDGVWHDWLEDAIAFSVADTRYTAGVANLRAQVISNSFAAGS
ncbi:MAG: Wzt carbohydrate-binding domain-containing protein [Bryobacteraceae bacterium]